MENKVTLGYWSIRGLAQRIRMLMEYMKLPYEQQLYDGTTRQKWFKEIKPELMKKNAAITLPYLLDGDKVVSESQAIIIYVIHKGGKKQLLGRNLDEQIGIATAYGILKDVHPLYIRLSYGAHGMESYQLAHKQYVQKFKPYLTKWTGMLGQQNWICGNITWVDFAICEFLQCLFLQTPALKEQFPKLLAYQERFWGLQQLAEYFKSERWIQRPCNNTSAQWK